MGRRGPTALPADKKKSAAIGLRITPDLRQRLEEERRKAVPKRTLSQEIEIRLLESFELEKKIEERFRGRRTYYILQMIADGIGLAECATERHWLDDAYTYDEIASFVCEALRLLRPKGKRAFPRELLPPEHIKKGMLGDDIAHSVIWKYQIDTRGTQMPITKDELKLFKSSPTILAQLAKSGRSSGYFDPVTGRTVPLSDKPKRGFRR
jgi:hypothetical protein